MKKPNNIDTTLSTEEFDTILDNAAPKAIKLAFENRKEQTDNSAGFSPSNINYTYTPSFVSKRIKERVKTCYIEGAGDAKKTLQALAIQYKQAKHPSIPPHALPVPKYQLTKTNGLTAAIIDLIDFTGGFAGRVNTQGQYREDLGKWTKSGSTPGMPDIVAVIGGRSVFIEVKTGRDKLRPDQIKVKEASESAGGIYYVARSFDAFFTFHFHTFIKPAFR